MKKKDRKNDCYYRFGLWANTNRYRRDYNFIYACACVHIGT